MGKYVAHFLERGFAVEIHTEDCGRLNMLPERDVWPVPGDTSAEAVAYVEREEDAVMRGLKVTACPCAAGDQQ